MLADVVVAGVLVGARAVRPTVYKRHSNYYCIKLELEISY